MGYHYPPDIYSRSELVAYLRQYATNGGKRTLLASSVVGNHHWYVCEYTTASGERLAFIGLDLMVGGGRRDPGWAYKPLVEGWHPCYYDCPLGFLEMAPEANPAWRQKVRQHHAARRTRPKIAAGLSFTHQGQRHTVIGRTPTGRGWLVEPEGGLVMRASSIVLRSILDRQTAAANET